jgi:2-polyprenyl-6-hydroxyphenyl methylase/3-demethylubiquinone-9 3-methyltransferase
VFDYYDDKLSAEKLRRVYDIAPARVQQYFEAEIEHVLTRIVPDSRVLELGCGYGRVLERLAGKSRFVVGIDTSLASLKLARQSLISSSNCHLARMNAIQLALADDSFDVVICIQNGISAFHVDPAQLINEAVRVTRPGGSVLFSSYSEKLWPDRLQWFEMQAQAGLLGAIDYEKTGDGQIVCTDGFTATTVTPEEFQRLTEHLDARVDITEVDESSVFCEICLSTGSYKVHPSTRSG